MGASSAGVVEGILLKLGYRPPYRWEALIDFLARRALPGIEAVWDNRYFRTLSLRRGGRRYDGWIAAANRARENALELTVSPSLLPVVSVAINRVRSLFDLNGDPEGIYDTLSRMNDIAPGLCVKGTRLPGAVDPFEIAVRAVLGQQLSIKSARTLCARLAAALGDPIDTPFEGLNRIFPDFYTLYELGPSIEERLGPLGIRRTQARALYALAEALGEGRISLSSRSYPEEEMEKLLSIRGFGPWTVQYIAMRALNWPDAFPHTDYGVKKALAGRSQAEILALSQDWRPWRAYAAINLWNSLKT
jgi:AraC family transcriptional regulator of adaptative response / DNA-3-methyladenine glycosylase II